MKRSHRQAELQIERPCQNLTNVIVNYRHDVESGLSDGRSSGSTTGSTDRVQDVRLRELTTRQPAGPETHISSYDARNPPGPSVRTAGDSERLEHYRQRPDRNASSVVDDKPAAAPLQEDKPQLIRNCEHAGVGDLTMRFKEMVDNISAETAVEQDAWTRELMNS